MNRPLTLLILVIVVVIVVLLLLNVTAQEEPVDIVYSWIDGNDPDVQKEIQYWKKQYNLPGTSATSNRFRAMDELRYSLRSVRENAPWVRNVYVVTSLHKIPAWFNENIGAEHGVYFIDDSELLDTVPVFNSLAKEAVKHKIPGLSERYLYFNDDLFFGSPVTLDDFQDDKGRAKMFLEPEHFVPHDYEGIGEQDYFAKGLYYTQSVLMDLFPELEDKQVQEMFMHMQLKRHTPDLHFVSEDFEKERLLPELTKHTANSRFRGIDQLYDNTLFDNYWKLARGKAIPSEISTVLMGLEGKNEQEEMMFERIRTERPKCFCVNDGIADDTTPEAQASIEFFGNFLEEYYPTAAPWEQ